MAKKTLKVAFLGGVGEIGKNMTALIYGENILIIDAGMSFPDDDMPGIDAVIPDFTFLRENRDKIRGIVLTHGHEDHIGALPYLLGEFDVPVYGSDVTLALLAVKLSERKMTARTFKVNNGDIINLPPFKVEFFHVCHSVSGAFALSVTTAAGVVFHTGDYKMDYTPVDEEPTDIGRISELGKRGVLLMLGESTNVEREGYTVSERAVGETFDHIFSDNQERRIIVATFSSNINRMHQIADVARKYGRKICFGGRSMIKTAEIGRELGILKIDAEDIVEMDRAVKMPDRRLCIVVTGSQGEPMSALSRMACGEYNKINIGSNDTIIISASPIPGNERSVYSVINNLYKLGARVCYYTLRDIHVSGHAHREELKLMLSMVHPKYFMPVHGEYRHQVKHAELAELLGVPDENISIPQVGWCVNIAEGLKRDPDITAGNSYIDGDTVGDNMELVIQDRKILSEDGLIIIVASVKEDGSLFSPPDILYRGVSVNDDFSAALCKQVADIFRDKKYTNDLRGALKNRIGKSARILARKSLKTNPMIVPIIVEK